MLNSLVIKNYRNLKDLKIDSLGRVNLFIGKNNIGKSTLLEAVAIYATAGDLNLIYRLLQQRGEIVSDKEEAKDPLEDNMQMFSSLFTERIVDFENKHSISIGPIESTEISSAKSVTLRFIKYIEETEKDNQGRISRRPKVLDGEVDGQIADYKIGFEAKIGNTSYMLYPLNSYRPYRFGGYRGQMTTDNSNHVSFQLVQTGNIEREINPNLWDRITLTDKEKYVIEALRIIEPGTDRIAFIADRTNTKERSAVIKLTSGDKVLPIRSMGDGINRVLTIILALVNSENKYFLLDEFENGLHHSVQKDLWKIIFKLSKELNIQVFATTHSEDCIAGFGKVLNNPDNLADGKLIRLENRKGKFRIVEYAPDEIRIATEHHIETR